mmetsp:Transcript_19615/g.56450  ORF Transcript_19615/g.56450 Transcript_19615/m.56450 type:complete len:295 (+) Transcript_19615:3254-4138(+)
MEVVVRGCQNFINHLGRASKRRRNRNVAIFPEGRWVGIVLLLVIRIRMIVNLKRRGVHKMGHGSGTPLPLHLEQLFHDGLHHPALGRILGPGHGLGQPDAILVLVEHGRMVRIGQMDHVGDVGVGLKDGVQQGNLAGVKVFRYGWAEIAPVEVHTVANGLQNVEGPLPLELEQGQLLLRPRLERILVLGRHPVLPIVLRLHVPRGTHGGPPGTQAGRHGVDAQQFAGTVRPVQRHGQFGADESGGPQNEYDGIFVEVVALVRSVVRCGGGGRCGSCHPHHRGSQEQGSEGQCNA